MNKSEAEEKRPLLYETGVIHGRFQILHRDHLKYLLAGKDLCRHLVVGITNPDPLRTKEDRADPGRSKKESNPLTYYERAIMITEALVEAGVQRDAFTIVPFPINHPELYRCYVPLDAVFFLTIYDDWGKKKRDTFLNLGLTIHVLWEAPIEQKGIRGSEVREAMAKNLPWEHLVPPSVAKMMKTWDIPARLRRQAMEPA